MNTVNITDANTWSSIEIFVFSNGQQYSPPRKYHLRAEELQWWGCTVSFLGRTQYGSGHSTVDLYTIDGTKVNGPLELVNGAAYVAVEPPDAFVDAGYEEYLVKASRSWEKRLVQKINGAGMSKPVTDEIALKTIYSRSNIDNENMIIDEDAVTKVQTSKVTDNMNTSPLKTPPTVLQQYLQRKSVSATKQIQKRKSSDTNNVSVRKLSADKGRSIPCSRKIPTRKNDGQVRKVSTTAPYKKYERQYACNNKRNSTNSNNEGHGINRSSVQSDKVTSNSKKYLQIQAQTNEPNIQEFKVLKEASNSPTSKETPFLYKSTNNDIKSEIADPEKDVATEKFPDYYEHNQFPLNDNSIPNGVKTERGEHKTKEIFENDKADILRNKESIGNQMILEQQVNDEYIAYMNKGGILLLKFNLKVKDCKALCNREMNGSLHANSRSSNLLKTEKHSQVDIAINFNAELLKTDEELCIQNKSLQSLLNKLHTDNINNAKHPKIIIVQCACNDYSMNNKVYTCDTIFNSQNTQDGKIEEMRENKLMKSLTSCECNGDQSGTLKADHYGLQENIIRMSVPNANTNKVEVPEANAASENYTENKFEDSRRHNSFNGGCNNSPNEKRMSWNNNDLQTTVYKRDSPIFNQNNDTEKAIGEENINSESKLTCDKSTQTNWSNILLEARRNEDDNYTFHLPSLYILKRCML